MRKVLASLLLLGCATLLLPQQTAGPLVPGFSMRPAMPYVGDRIQFTDLSRGNPISWLWDFGDGTTSTEQNPTHVYTTVGVFEISFTVDDGTGAVTMTRKL